MKTSIHYGYFVKDFLSACEERQKDDGETCRYCHWAEQCTDGLFCVENEKAVEPGDTCFRFMPNK